MELKVGELVGTYERKARLYPALLALIAPLAAFWSISSRDLSAPSMVVIFGSQMGIFFLLASISRHLGSRVEMKNFERWGGQPTTQLLRHSDQTIDRVTKERYHRFLSAAMSRHFPNKDEEIRDPISADQTYGSAVLWLRDHTRDRHVFTILFHENIAYGFARNGQALKPAALSLALGATFVLLHVNGLLTTGGLNFRSTAGTSQSALAALAVSMSASAVWLLYFTESATKAAAFTYAKALLRACDTLPTPATTSGIIVRPS
jgi:hypothetical protein